MVSGMIKIGCCDVLIGFTSDFYVCEFSADEPVRVIGYRSLCSAGAAKEFRTATNREQWAWRDVLTSVLIFESQQRTF